MISDLVLHSIDEKLTVKDFNWHADIKLISSEINKQAVFDWYRIKTPSDKANNIPREESDRRNLNMSFEDFMSPVLDETPGILWFFTIPISLLSYFYQKRIIKKFKEDNVEYFI